MATVSGRDVPIRAVVRGREKGHLEPLPEFAYAATLKPTTMQGDPKS